MVEQREAGRALDSRGGLVKRCLRLKAQVPCWEIWCVTWETPSHVNHNVDDFIGTIHLGRSHRTFRSSVGVVMFKKQNFRAKKSEDYLSRGPTVQ